MRHAATVLTFVVATLPLLAGPVWAGSVTLEPGEITALRALVAKDAAAAAQLAPLRKLADAALSDKPNPVQVVISEGRLESDPDKIRSTKSLEDIDKVEALAWTWAVSGDEKYAAKGRAFILAWAKTNQPDGNPINETKFEPLIEGYDLLRPGFSASDRALVDAWLSKKAQALIANKRSIKENWQSHRLKVVGLIGATIGDASLWKTSDSGFKAQMQENFKANGESLDFERRDAMHYHLYSIQPMLTLACVAQRRGEPLFTYTAPNGASLQGAVEFMRPYATGEKKHVEFVNSQVKFDRTRAAAGQSEYAAHNWNPKTSVRTYAEAGCVEPKYNAFAAVVAGTPNKAYVNWRSVLNAASTTPPTR
jgi:Alginate lyase